MPKKTCNLCIDVDKPDHCCKAETVMRGGSSMLCTRPDGHKGDHAACGAREHDHPIYTWPQLKVSNG